MYFQDWCRESTLCITFLYHLLSHFSTFTCHLKATGRLLWPHPSHLYSSRDEGGKDFLSWGRKDHCDNTSVGKAKNRPGTPWQTYTYVSQWPLWHIASSGWKMTLEKGVANRDWANQLILTTTLSLLHSIPVTRHSMSDIEWVLNTCQISFWEPPGTTFPVCVTRHYVRPRQYSRSNTYYFRP